MHSSRGHITSSLGREAPAWFEIG